MRHFDFGHHRRPPLERLLEDARLRGYAGARNDEIRGFNAEVVAISVDNVWSHKAWAEHQHINFPLLADFWPHGDVAKKYGVFLDKDGISNRALFFIDGSGKIRNSWVAENPTVAPGINIIFDALQEIQGGKPQEARRA